MSEESELDAVLLKLARLCIEEEREDRYALLQDLRKYELLIAGFQVWWNLESMAWNTWQDALRRDPTLGAPDKYSKVVNILKAHLEAITAAITATAPKTSFSPENSNNPDDVIASQSMTHLSTLIDVHNDAPLLFVRAVVILYTQGPIFTYNYYKKDKAFGIAVKKTSVPKEVEQEMPACPTCGVLREGEGACLECGDESEPMMEMVSGTQNEVIEEKFEKGREIMEVYGQLHVKIPRWVTKQNGTPYLSLIDEFPTSLIKSLYPKKANKIGVSGDQTEREAKEPIERPTVYRETDIVYRTWIRPWKYWDLNDEERKLIEKKYPDGVYVVSLEDLFLEAHPENLDEHWTIFENPLSNRIHFEPLIKIAVPLQQLINEAINMIWERVEKGIPMTIIDSNTIPVKQFSERPQEAGEIIVASLPATESLAAKIHQTRTTDLPPEIPKLVEQLFHIAEFLLGSLPGIWGGASTEGSKTFGESERMRTTALQRLGLYWSFIRHMWNRAKLKATMEFRAHMVADEELSIMSGGFPSSIPIRKADLGGSVRGVYPETDESFPLTWVERADRAFALLEKNNPDITTAMLDLENVSRMKRILGFPDFFIPGEDQRNMELRIIGELIKSGPIMPGVPTISPDPIVDNLDIHMRTCQNWLSSPLGLWHKENNQAGYENVKAHLNAHMMSVKAPAPPDETPPEVEIPGLQESSGVTDLEDPRNSGMVTDLEVPEGY